jgi:hypothetical protein
MHKVKWYQLFREDAVSDVFYCESPYSDPVCEVSIGERTILITCDGEMILDYKGSRLRHKFDLAKYGITNDKEYTEALQNWEAEFDHNPWFGSSIKFQNEYVDLETVYENINEAIEDSIRILNTFTNEELIGRPV